MSGGFSLMGIGKTEAISIWLSVEGFDLKKCKKYE